jgi:hypothetical protein
MTLLSRVEVLQARDFDRPALVAEVALYLAENGRCGVGGQLHSPVEVEPIDRLDEADTADLDQVLYRLATGGEPARKTSHQRQIAGDEFLSSC